jgi:hypothetical protein
MTLATTVLHIHGHGTDEIEQALEGIFAREERPRVLRLQGTYSAVLARALAPELGAGYRYLLLRPHAGSGWTPLLELGNRTEGLDRGLSAALGGTPVFATFVYGDAVSGYRMVRGGTELDRYISDPEYFASLGTDEAAPDDAGAVALAPDALDLSSPGALDALRGHPERFADLLPDGTTPEEFERVVLRPGWWEEHLGGVSATDAVEGEGMPETEDAQESEDEDLVDEADRMRCIGLALELWAPSEYPFAGELEEIANTEAGPAVALAFA